MQEKIIYRDYYDGDSNGISQIEKMCFSEPWSKSAVEEFISYDTSHVLVAQAQENIAGYITFMTVLDEVQIANVAVHPDFRRQHIGESLLYELFKFSQKNGCAFITLEVRESNQAAIALYKKCGYEIVGQRKNFYSNPKENAILMNKVL